MIILGIDPGTATTGYGIVRQDTSGKLIPIDFGAILTFPETPVIERLSQIYDAVNLLIDKHSPDAVATERLFFSKNETTAISVGRAIGVILLAIAQHNLPWTEYTPMQVKQAVTGTGSADKKQIQWMVTRLLGLKAAPKPDDTADALAIAICHAHSAKLGALGVRNR
ncbi:MAG: crossover junction endodeoxyribonuclease RuvC [Capsulimonadaceae bacterium]|nr:crossover junction endodeoxyribonuclease RuvC [Capsulimonadaceae bacterium]